MTEEELSEIEARLQATTAAPWEPWICYRCNYLHLGKRDRSAAWVCPDPRNGTLAKPTDLEFIAHARSDVPALVAEVRRLQDGIRWLAQTVHQAGHDGGWESCPKATCDYARKLLAGGGGWPAP